MLLAGQAVTEYTGHGKAAQHGSINPLFPLFRLALRPVRIAARTEEMRRHSKAATQPPFLFPATADALRLSKAEGPAVWAGPSVCVRLRNGFSRRQRGCRT